MSSFLFHFFERINRGGLKTVNINYKKWQILLHCYLIIIIKDLELGSGLQHWAKNMLEVFVVWYISIWPNFILIVLSIQKRYFQLCSSAYDNITDFEIWGFHINTKMQISQKQNIIFCSNKKIHWLHIKGYFMAKNILVMKVTFNYIFMMGLDLFELRQDKLQPFSEYYSLHMKIRKRGGK